MRFGSKHYGRGTSYILASNLVSLNRLGAWLYNPPDFEEIAGIPERGWLRITFGVNTND